MLTKVSALVLLFSSVMAAANLEQGLHGLQLAPDQQAYKLQVENFATMLWSCASLSQKGFFLQIERVLAVNSDLEARVTALETQMVGIFHSL